ncbi:MAG TPA: hypothetical protein VLL04_14865 [Rhizomicrobium sp.]|nr:hypothetical protein [Rhizomicrobium sp.]
MTRILTIALCALSISIPALAKSAPGDAKVYPTRPVGKGNPSSISCYLKDETLSRIATKVCKTNAEWARIQTRINENFSTADFN